VAIYEHWAGRRGVPHDVLEKNRDILRMAAMLHDVGKVAISDAILKKPARLDDAEREIMKQHTINGRPPLLEQYSEFDDASAVVGAEPPREVDGTGYRATSIPSTAKWRRATRTAMDRRGRRRGTRSPCSAGSSLWRMSMTP